jgi:hypothetical protein
MNPEANTRHILYEKFSQKTSARYFITHLLENTIIHVEDGPIIYYCKNKEIVLKLKLGFLSSMSNQIDVFVMTGFSLRLSRDVVWEELRQRISKDYPVDRENISWISNQRFSEKEEKDLLNNLQK